MTNLLLIPSMFSPASAEAGEIYSLTIYFIIAATAILLIVVGLLIYVVVKFRAKPGDGEPRQFTGNKVVESFMIGVPMLLVGGFFFLTARTMKHMLPPRPQPTTRCSHYGSSVLVGSSLPWYKSDCGERDSPTGGP